MRLNTISLRKGVNRFYFFPFYMPKISIINSVWIWTSSSYITYSTKFGLFCKLFFLIHNFYKFVDYSFKHKDLSWIIFLSLVNIPPTGHKTITSTMKWAKNYKKWLKFLKRKISKSKTSPIKTFPSKWQSLNFSSNFKMKKIKPKPLKNQLKTITGKTQSLAWDKNHASTAPTATATTIIAPFWLSIST